MKNIDETGGVTVLVAGVLVSIVALALIFFSAGTVFVTHTKAQTAADMAAVAGAYALNSGHGIKVASETSGRPCEVARVVANANEFKLARCFRSDRDILVQLTPRKMFFGVVNVSARARAGPDDDR